MKYLRKPAGETLARLRAKTEAHHHVLLVPPNLPLRDGRYTMFALFEGAGSSEHPVLVRGGQFRLPIDAIDLDEKRAAVLAFLSNEDWEGAAADPNPAGYYLEQAIATLSAALHIDLMPTDAALVHHFQSDRVAAAATPSDGLGLEAMITPALEWTRLEAYFDLRGRIEARGVRIVEGKLYAHLTVDAGALPQGRALPVGELVERMTAETGWFNYEPCSYDMARDLVTARGIKVVEADGLRSPSSLIRVFRHNGGFDDHIILNGGLPGLSKAFLLLYEFCHVQRDLAAIREMPPQRDESGLYALVPQLLGSASNEIAEAFAAAGLFPAAGVAWAFREELGAGSWLDQLASFESLKPDAEQRMLEVLHDDMRVDVLPAIPRNLASVLRARLRRTCRETLRWAARLRAFIGADTLTLASAECLTTALKGSWSWADADRKIIACSEEFARHLGLAVDELRGRSVLEIIDRASAERLVVDEPMRRSRRRPSLYYCGYLVPGAEGGRKVARLVSFAVVDGEEHKGALALIERIPEPLVPREWPPVEPLPAGKVEVSELPATEVGRLSATLAHLATRLGRIANLGSGDVNALSEYGRIEAELRTLRLLSSRKTSPGQALRRLHNIVRSNPYAGLEASQLGAIASYASRLAAGDTPDLAEGPLLRAGVRPFLRGMFVPAGAEEGKDAEGEHDGSDRID